MMLLLCMQLQLLLYIYIFICIYIAYSSQGNLSTQYILHFLLIFRSQPSGNCLNSSLFILLYGNSGYIDELRVLNLIEPFMYPSYYYKLPCFLSLSQTFEKAETHFFTMSIKNSTIDSDLKNEEAVKFEAQTNCKIKGWSSFLCVLALASVIKRKLFSHFPDCRDEMHRVVRNQVICLRVECLSEVLVHVLFGKFGGQRLHEKRFFQGDHFVPLIQFYNRSRKRKSALQHLQTQTKKVKLM